MPLTVAVPREVVPQKNVTAPVAPLVTVAVSTTLAPVPTELAEALNVVVDADFVTVTAAAADVDSL